MRADMHVSKIKRIHPLTIHQRTNPHNSRFLFDPHWIGQQQQQQLQRRRRHQQCARRDVTLDRNTIDRFVARRESTPPPSSIPKRRARSSSSASSSPTSRSSSSTNTSSSRSETTTTTNVRDTDIDASSAIADHSPPRTPTTTAPSSNAPTANKKEKLHNRSMDRSPLEPTENQKRRKKSQEETAHDDDMDDDERELFHIVVEDLRIKSTVGWQNAVKSLSAALQHLERNESQRFLDYAFPKIVSIMLEQHSSKIGSFEKSCVTQTLSVGIALVVALLKAGSHLLAYRHALAVLVMVFNKKKTFYKDLRTSAMIGSYWNKVPGAPEVRAQCIAAFCELDGFVLLLTALEQQLLVAASAPTTPVATTTPRGSTSSSNDAFELEPALDSEDIRILLQALLEFRTSVPEALSTQLCVLVMTYFTNVPDAVLKKESSDAVGAVLTIIRRFVDAGVVSALAINQLWLELTQRYVESTSLPLRLFGIEQINLIVSCARATRAFPPRYIVRNAGTTMLNGVYTLKPDATTATYVFQPPNTDQLFTLFCCTMKSGSKWWFISEADAMQPGSDQDIDYYQHQSQYEEHLPPTHNWVPTGKGVAPPPELLPECVALEDEDEEEDTTRLDHVLGAWVANKRVVEEIFGDRIHREVVSRSALLIKFLAESNKLDAHYLDVIWQACIQKDQTLVDEIHSLLIATVPYLSNALLLHLVERIHDSLRVNLRKHEQFPELMSFLQRLATNAPSFLMDRSADVTTAILQLLWSIQMHCSIANVRLSRSLREFFQEGLRSEFGDPLRKTFLSECIAGIKRSCYSPVGAAPATPPGAVSPTPAVDATECDIVASKALELLKFLIDSYRTDQALVVESLDAEHGLVALLFDELAAFVARCAEKQTASYRTSIGHRLELLHYVHVKSPKLELTIPQIDRLWNVLSSSPAEREFCLIFFNQTSVRSSPQSSYPSVSSSSATTTNGGAGTISTAFNVAVCRHIFEELLCQQTDFATLGCMGYKCFHTYFVGLNAHHKQLESAASARDSDAPSLNVLGIDALWRIAFEAPIDVSELATKELLRVYERFSDDVGSDALAADTSVKDFLHRVFQKLGDVRDATPEALTLVRQCTNLLSGLATNPRRKQQLLQSPSVVAHGMAGRGAYFSVKILAQRIPTSSSSSSTIGGASTNNSPSAQEHTAIRTMHADVYANQTLWRLRKQLEVVVGHPLQQTKILSAGAAISGDHKTLAELNISETSELRVLLFNTIVQRGSLPTTADASGPMLMTSDDAAAQHHPGAIIARDATYFDVLFRVLDTVAGHAVHTALWDFLKKIPTAAELLNRVATIGLVDTSENDDDDVAMDASMASTAAPPLSRRTNATDWSSLLQTASHHRAIYTLQIMDALLLPADQTKNAFARTYLRRFIHGGGFHEVLSYFVQATFHTGSFNEGAAVALRILKFCLFDSGHSELYFSFTGATTTPTTHTPSDTVANVENDEGDAAIDSSTRAKIVIEQQSYDSLVEKIAELIVSEYTRSEATHGRTKATPRILIDAIKTVESIVTIAPSAADRYMASQPLQQLVAAVLLQSPSEQVREQWLSSLQSICRASSAAASAVLERVIASVQAIERVAVSVAQYAQLLRLLAQADDSASSTTAQLRRTLAQTVLRKLHAGFSPKFLACNERAVEVLVACLEFLRDALAHDAADDALARDVVDVVYTECLFTLPSVDRQRGPLCVSLETRRPAFKLLATAISTHASILPELQTRLSRLFTRSDALQFKWGQESNVETRGSGEYVGLKNQGCSCYMNSFLQQLFMEPTLRQGLLAARVPPRPTPKEPTKAEAERNPARLIGSRVAVECVGGRVYEANVVAFDPPSRCHTLRYDDGGEASFVLAEGRAGNENGRFAILPTELSGTEATLEVLRQVQRTFCYLRDSEMRYFNPKALVESCKCLNLEFSVYQQNDASEFCDKLLDRLETGLKNTPQGVECLTTALSGKLISQKLPKDCGHRYEREEPFIRLELQIRGKESIEESLAAFVEGEVMDGDNKVECEQCATKKAAVRRTCFGELPNFLILHLKRFDLDYSTFETVKLNNRCSFPMNLNMKPYTKAGIEEMEAATTAIGGMHDGDTSSSNSSDDDDDEDDDSDAGDAHDGNDDNVLSDAASAASDDFMGDGGIRDSDAVSSPVASVPLSSTVRSSTDTGHSSSDETTATTTTTTATAATSNSDTGDDSDADLDASALDPHFEYRLKGILVHSGVAQGGHYYSFIYDHVSEKWFKFDDEDVSPFDPSNIETECFGGVQRRSWHGSSSSMEMEVFSNALMLFYEKVVPVTPSSAVASSVGTKAVVDESDAIMTDVSSPPSSALVANGATATTIDVIDANVRCEYEAEVWKSNEVFLQNSYLFDVEFHEFLREMVQSKYIKDATASSLLPHAAASLSSVPPPPPSPSASALVDLCADEQTQTTLTDVGIEFVLSVLLHSREKHGIARWITVLAAKFAKHKQICVRFFDALATTKRVQWLRSLVFECPDSIARQSFVHLVSRALTAYDAHLTATPPDAADAVVLRRFVEALAEFLDQTSVMQQSHLEECFMLIRNVAEHCATARAALQNVDMVARLVNFFLSDRAPSAIKDAFPSSHLPPATSRYASPDYQYLLEAIAAILGLPRRSTEPLLAESTSGQSPHRVTLSDKANAALTEIFADYQVDGGLGVDELVKYLRTSVHSAGLATGLEANARALLLKYGNHATPQRIELDAFLLYYADIAATSTKLVLQDLRAFGFGDDLKRQTRNLPLASTVLAHLRPLSRNALQNDVFFDSALEEDAETVGDLLLRISVGDRDTSAMLLRSLLLCMNSTETGWKGQPVVDVCTHLLEHLLSYDAFAFTPDLITQTLVHPEFGLITTAATREKLRGRFVNNSHVPLFVLRQITTVVTLACRIPHVRAWLEAHQREWSWTYEWLRIESLQPSLGGRLALLFREPAKTDLLLQLGNILNTPFVTEARSFLVDGAGFADVNGVYCSSNAHRTFDNCLTFTYTSPATQVEYTLFRCMMPSKTRRWYISYSPNKSLLGTMSDEDYYFIQCSVDVELPPVDGWKVWTKNDKARPPAPTVRLFDSTVDQIRGIATSEDGEEEEEEVDLGGGIGNRNNSDSLGGRSLVVGSSGNAVDDDDDDDFGDDADVDDSADVDADTVEYDDSEDEIRVSNERFQAVHLDTHDDDRDGDGDGGTSSGADDFM